MLTDEQRRLVEDNINLIYHFMNKYRLSENAIEDYYGTLSIVLCRAAIHYNDKKGCKFSTYAFTAMKRELYNCHRSSNRSIECEISLEDLINEYENISYKDIIRSNECLEEDVLDRQLLIDAIDEIFKTNKIKPTRHNVITLYTNTCLSQQEIADKLGVSKQRVNQIIKDFIDKLKILTITE